MTEKRTWLKEKESRWVAPLDREADLQGIKAVLVCRAMTVGGLETFLLNTAHYLCAAGATVDIMTTIDPGPWFGRIEAVGANAIHVDFPVGGSSGYDHAVKVGRALRKRAYDIVVLNTAKHAQVAAHWLGNDVGIVSVIHDNADWASSLGCINADALNAIVTVSPAVHARTNAFAQGRPVILIPHGIELVEEQKWLKRRSWDKPLRVAVVGRLTQDKGAHLLPAVFEAVKTKGLRVDVQIIGEGPLLPTVQHSTENNDLVDVKFLGNISHEQVYEVLLEAHVLLFPSLSEAFGLALVEAQTCGCVPIASRLPGVTDFVVQDGVSGLLIEPEDVHGFASALLRLGTNSEQWSGMSQAGRQYAASFSLDSMGAKYVNLVKDVLGGKYALSHSRRLFRPIRGFPFTARECTPIWLRNMIRPIRRLLRARPSDA